MEIKHDKVLWQKKMCKGVLKASKTKEAEKCKKLVKNSGAITSSSLTFIDVRDYIMVYKP